MSAAPSGRRWFTFIPLVLLLLAVLVTATIGFTREPAPQHHEARPLAFIGDRDACRPDTGPVAKGPWRGGPAERKAAERAYVSHRAAEDDVYVRGTHGQVFFNDWVWENFSQAVGRTHDSPRQLRRWARWIRTQQRIAARHGSHFEVVVAPAKWDVYDDTLPAWAKELKGRTTYEDLLQSYPNLPLIDVRSTLREHRRTAPTYAPLNSHWTAYGAYVAWQAIAGCLSTLPGVPTIEAPGLEGIDRADEGSEFTAQGLLPHGRHWAIPRLAPGPRVDITSADGQRLDLTGSEPVAPTLLPIHTVTHGATSNLRLLALRDSTGSDMSPLWTRAMAETWQYAHGIDRGSLPASLDSLLTEHPADVTLLMFTEREFHFPPPGDPS